ISTGVGIGKHDASKRPRLGRGEALQYGFAARSSDGDRGASYRVDVDHLRTTIGQQRREGRLSGVDSPAETDNHHDQATYATRTQVRQYGPSLGEGSIGVE